MVLPHLPHHTRSFAQRTAGWNYPSKSSPRAESRYYLGPGIDHPSDSLRVLTRAKKVVETRDVTWEATLDVGAPSPQLPEIPEQGGT